LVYVTCAYSFEENERVGEWLLSKFPQFQPQVVPHLAEYQSHLTELPCYRMFPQDRLGAGAFTMLLHNTNDVAPASDALANFLNRPKLIQLKLPDLLHSEAVSQEC
jgi:hypothetical protein